MPDHFFVSGEPVNYSVGINTHVRVAIEPTSFTGIGTTSLLPTNANVYIIKDNDATVRLASSAENALASTPVAIGITGVGFGTFHTFKSIKQNSKCLIAIDNYIQNPIVSTAVTTSVEKEISLGDSIIETIGVTSFFAADLIQIEAEIMKINTVGFGTTNGILVDRGWMGTGITLTLLVLQLPKLMVRIILLIIISISTLHHEDLFQLVQLQILLMREIGLVSQLTLSSGKIFH